MSERKPERMKHEQKNQNETVDLENQFILRLPEEPAKKLREALQAGNLKDRISIKLDNDLRYGEFRFDHWMLHAKVVDLPTVAECLKTIDNKSFYKTADICQMMICKEEADALDPEKESPNKGKKKDPNKVDKKFLWPHGITPPCKNVRKRRFRKTLKKKNVEAPEIEKEVKRLLRVDNDAVKVDFEIINEDIEKPLLDQQIKEEGEEDTNNETLNEADKASNSSQKEINVESDGGEDDAQFNTVPMGGIDEQDIFGEELSSSDDDDLGERRNTNPVNDLAEASRLSADDSRLSDFSTSAEGNSGTGDLTNQMTTKDSPNEFNKSMFNSPRADGDDSRSKFDGSSSNLDAPTSFYDANKSRQYDEEASSDVPQLTKDEIQSKLIGLQHECDDLQEQRTQKAQEIESIENPTLKLRMEEALENIECEIFEKERSKSNYERMLNTSQ